MGSTFSLLDDDKGICAKLVAAKELYLVILNFKTESKYTTRRKMENDLSKDEIERSQMSKLAQEHIIYLSFTIRGGDGKFSKGV